MLFAAVMYLHEGLSLETLLTVEAQKSVIYSLGTQRPAVPIREQQLMSLETIKAIQFN
jgi:hypothetical protein